MIVSGLAQGYLEEKKLIGIASTGGKPALHDPAAPPARDSGIAGLKDYDETPWVGFGLAAGVPAPLVQAWHRVLVNALESATVRNSLSSMGQIETTSSEELMRIIARELEGNRQLLDSGRVKLT
jgi:tripartite-type tricarboxylate transporter receptor subunit TctC